MLKHSESQPQTEIDAEANSNAHLGFISSGSQFTVSDISYDPQGNIETLTRNAPTMGNPFGAPVDLLDYTSATGSSGLNFGLDALMIGIQQRLP